MKEELRLHRLTFGVLAALLVLFVLLLHRLQPGLAAQTPKDEHIETVVSLAVVAAAATIFLIVGSLEGAIALDFGRTRRRELVAYLLLAALSLVSGLYLALADSATIQTVALVAAPHALLFGLAQLRLARHLERHAAYRRALLVCGIVELLLGLTLLRAAWLPTQETVAVLGYVAVLSVLQILALLFFRFRSPASAHPAAGTLHKKA